jgi:hypothetical protein
MLFRVISEPSQRTLPEGEEDNRLDGEELEDGFKWGEQLTSCKVEEEKPV